MSAFATDAFEPSELPADPDLAPGQRVGEYEVDGKLGQGAFGTVFRAVHPVIPAEPAFRTVTSPWNPPVH